VLAIKSKVLDRHTIPNIEALKNINKEYFSGNLYKVLKKQITNKTLSVIVDFVFNVVAYSLAKEGGHEEDTLDDNIS
jgi:hypothetical protein